MIGLSVLLGLSVSASAADVSDAALKKARTLSSEVPAVGKTAVLVPEFTARVRSAVRYLGGRLETKRPFPEDPYPVVESEADDRHWREGCVDLEPLREQVITFKGGTGVLVAPKIAITNHHVAKRWLEDPKTHVASRYEIETHMDRPGGFAYRPVRVLHIDERVDLAVVEVPELERAQTAKIAESEIDIDADQRIFSIGHGRNNLWRIGRLNLWGRARVRLDGGYNRDSLLYRGFVGPRGSGSPLFDCSGKVVGIHSHSREFFKESIAIGFGAHASDIRRVLAEAGVVLP